jgi:crossover junction endodeoxyribonuclease RuvC
MKILGIDASLRSTGYGVVEVNGNEMRALCHGYIKNPPKLLPSRCLVSIDKEVRKLIENHKPDAVAVEGLVYVQDTQIGFTLGQARGVVIAAAAANALPIYEYAPRKVRQSVTGSGAAGKTQVGNMVKAVLGMPEVPQSDAGDALAIAICHAHSCRGVQARPLRQI